MSDTGKAHSANYVKDLKMYSNLHFYALNRSFCRLPFRLLRGMDDTLAANHAFG